MSPLIIDRLLAAFAGRLNAASVCIIEDGWRLSFPAYNAVTVHFVLQGAGFVRFGDAAWQPFAPRSVIVVPAQLAHAMGDPRPGSPESVGGEHCAPFGEGFVAFTAGDGTGAGQSRPDIRMVCGSLPWPDSHALGLMQILGGPLVEAFAGAASHHPIFDLMLAELRHPVIGMRAMTEALMHQALILLLRQRLQHGTGAWPVAALGHPGLLKAVVAVLESPAAPHSVEGLATLAGMSRSAFAEAFSRAFGQGPMEFVQKTRLGAAMRLLTTTDLPVKVIATSVGYASRSHFSRAFAAAYGMDPSSLRSSGQAAPQTA